MLDGQLRIDTVISGVDDYQLVDLVREAAKQGQVLVGLDAPLSYQPGGRSRESDKELRRRIVDAGMRPGSVMAPTATRMSYLTLRGVVTARAIAFAAPNSRIVEAHPGATMALRGAPVEAIRQMKKEPRARVELVCWLASVGVAAIPRRALTDHEVAALACALAAWSWHRDSSVWLWKAEPPHHPYDFAC